MSTENDAYSRDHESVDLGKQLGQPTVGPNGIFPDTSQSPLAQSRGGADPVNIGPGSVKTK